MWIFQKIRRAMDNPDAARRLLYSNMEELNKQLHYKINGSQYVKKGTDIFQESWDNLIILDSCRYDIFEEICNLDGKLESRLSQGSMTEEFIRGNFDNKELHDTVYIAGNYWYMKAQGRVNSEVYKFIPVDLDAFDGDAAFPETVTKTARKASNNFPNKRLIVHYNQPHQPYFDKDGELFARPVSYRFELPKHGYEHKDIVDAYRATLQTVLNEVQRLLLDLNGKTVITADHGELLGERAWPLPFKIYGHPRGARTKKLLKVPWFIISSNGKKNIIKEDPTNELDMEAKTKVNEHLRDLGYKL